MFFLLQNQFPSLVHISLRLLRILTKNQKKIKRQRALSTRRHASHFIEQRIILIKIQKQTLGMLRSRFQIQRFHAESSENFTLLAEMSSLTDTQNEIEDFLCRRNGHPAHSAHLGMRWSRWKKTSIMISCLAQRVSCVSVGLGLIS